MEREAIVLLTNRNNALPLKKGGSVALIGPSAGVVSFGDYVFYNASNNGNRRTRNEGTCSGN